MPRLHDGRRRRSGGPGTSAFGTANERRRDVSAESHWPGAMESSNDTTGETAVGLPQHSPNTTAPPSSEKKKGPTMTPQVSLEAAKKESAPSSTASRFAALQKKKLRKKRRSAASFAEEDDSFSFGTTTTKRPRKSSPTATTHASSSTPPTPVPDFPTVTPAVSCCASVDSGTIDPDHIHNLGVKLAAACGGAGRSSSNNNNVATSSSDAHAKKSVLWQSPCLPVPTSKPAPLDENDERVLSLQKELEAMQERHRLELEQQKSKHQDEIKEWETKCQEKDDTIQELQGKHDAISIARDEEHANEIKGKDDKIKNLEQQLATSKTAQDEAVEAERMRIEAMWEEDARRLNVVQPKMKAMATTIQQMTSAQRELTKENDRQRKALDAEKSKVHALEAQIQATAGQVKTELAATPETASQSSCDIETNEHVPSAKEIDHEPARVLEASKKFQSVASDHYRGLSVFVTDIEAATVVEKELYLRGRSSETVPRRSPSLSPPRPHHKRRGNIPVPSFEVEKGVSLDEPKKKKVQRSRRKSA